MSEIDTSREAAERLCAIEENGGGCSDLQFTQFAPMIRALLAERDKAKEIGAHYIIEAARLDNRRADALDAVRSIETWGNSYPENIFKPLTEAEVAACTKAMDEHSGVKHASARLHASWGRHIFSGVRPYVEAARDALTEGGTVADTSAKNIAWAVRELRERGDARAQVVEAEIADMLEALADERDVLQARVAGLVEAADTWRDRNARLCNSLVGIKRAAGVRRQEKGGERHEYYYHTADAAIDMNDSGPTKESQDG